MRKPILAGNWKMNKTAEEAVTFVREVRFALNQIEGADVVVCPPGVKHWHGAAADGAMTHLAVTGSVDGKTVTWMEKVTDEHYNAH